MRLLDFLSELQGMVILSGYPSNLYDGTLIDWDRHERPAYADGGMPRTEVLWLNPHCSQRLKDVALRKASRQPLSLFEGL